MPAASIPLTEAAGQKLLLESQQRANFFSLASRLETQGTSSNCGPASAVMVLNALGLSAPASALHPPYHCFDQDNFFTPATEAILPRERLARQGATLEELGQMISTWGLSVEAVHAEPEGLPAFRERASQALGDPRQAVLVNFLRSPLAHEGGGHFCPLGAYHQGTDRFLVMDVARYKYAPWWIPAADLFRAMQTPDSTAGKNRGYLLVRRTAPTDPAP
jgi:hypothetical protein